MGKLRDTIALHENDCRFDTFSIKYVYGEFSHFPFFWYTGIPGLWTQELDAGLWTLDSGRWTLGAGPWTLNPGR